MQLIPRAPHFLADGQTMPNATHIPHATATGNSSRTFRRYETHETVEACCGQRLGKLAAPGHSTHSFCARRTGAECNSYPVRPCDRRRLPRIRHSVFQSGIVRVGYRFEPVGCAGRDGDMRKPAVPARAVPVLYSVADNNDVAGF